MGNRGGRLHDAQRKLSARRWVNRAWICCKLAFNNRHRKVWGNSYTELFFLDEVTAFAAGHRPCFECRRKDAERFALLFSGKKRAHRLRRWTKSFMPSGSMERPSAATAAKLDTLPDGAMISLDGQAFAVRGNRLLRWAPDGYSQSRSRPRGIDGRRADAAVDPHRAQARLWSALASERRLRLTVDQKAIRVRRSRHRSSDVDARRPATPPRL